MPNVLATLMHHPTLAGPFLVYNNVLLRITDARPTPARAHDPARRVAHGLRVRVGPAPAHRGRRRHHAGGDRRRRARRRRRRLDRARHRRAHRGRRARRRLPDRRRHVEPARRAARRTTARGARVRRRDLHRAGDGVQQLRARARRRPADDPRPATAPTSRSSNATHREAGRGQLDRALSGARHRADVLRGLDLPRVLRARARGDLQAHVAERRPGGAAPAQGELLHQGARGRQHVGRDRAGHGRRGTGVPQHLPAPRQQARVDRLPPRGVERQLPPVRVQVPRLEVRPRRRVLVRAAGGRVLRLRQGPTTASSRCTATCGPGSSS